MFLLLPAVQSASLANTSNIIQNKTYNFSFGSSVSGSFTGTDFNGDGFLETSEISDFNLFSNSLPNLISSDRDNSFHQCQTDGLKKLVYETPELKFNNQIKELENKIFKHIELEDPFIRTKETPIRSALSNTIRYVFSGESNNVEVKLEEIASYFRLSLEEVQISEGFFKEETAQQIKQMIIDFQNELEVNNSSTINESNNIYIHCVSDIPNSKLEFVLDNQQEQDKIRDNGSYSFKYSLKQDLNQRSGSISMTTSSDSVVVLENQEQKLPQFLLDNSWIK